MTEKAIATRPTDRLMLILSSQSVREQFDNALKENSGAFVASVIDLYSSDAVLQKCDPGAVVMECLKAATLKLPINKALGFAYIVPYGGKPQFQLGYKGLIQLAMRTGQYKVINAGIVYEGIEVQRDLLTGNIKFTGEPKGDKIQGYFAYIETINGFSKAMYMTAKEVIDHAKRYSKSFNQENGAWKQNFEAMAIKTPLRLLLSRYAMMSTEIQRALEIEVEDEVQEDIRTYANQEVIDVETGEITEEKPKAIKAESKGKPEKAEAHKCCVCGATENISPNEHGDYYCENCMTGKPTTKAPF